MLGRANAGREWLLRGDLNHKSLALARRLPNIGTPWGKSRHFDNEGCEAVTNQASFTTGPLVPVGRGWLWHEIAARRLCS